MVNRNGVLKIIGDEPNVESAYSMMTACLKTVKGGDDLEEQKIDYAISLAKEKQEEAKQSRKMMVYMMGGLLVMMTVALLIGKAVGWN